MLIEKRTKYWKYIILIVLMFGTLYTDTKVFLDDGKSAINTIEFIVYITNHQINICFYLLFFVCIIAGDIYDNTKNVSSIKKEIFIENNLKKVVIIPVISIFIYILLGMISFLLRYGYIDLSNAWSFEPGIYLSPLGALLTSILLLSFRFVSFSIIIFIINIVSKYPIGIMVPIAISIIDYWFYDVFDILKPSNILPLEHTRVFYTEAVAPSSGIISRGNYTASFLYWFVFVAVLLLILKIIVNKKTEKKESINENC